LSRCPVVALLLLYRFALLLLYRFTASPSFAFTRPCAPATTTNNNGHGGPTAA
jgi:hypothetical protein